MQCSKKSPPSAGSGKPAMVKIHIPALIRFFDLGGKKGEANRPHASALKGIFGEELGVQLLLHSLNSNRPNTGHCQQLNTSPIEEKGKRLLDAWIEDPGANGVGKRLLQVEVKSWSTHSYGSGLRWREGDDLEDYRKRAWAHYWDDKKKRLREASVGKVMGEMRSLDGFENWQRVPVACLWSPLPTTYEPGGDPAWIDLSKLEPKRRPGLVFSQCNYLLWMHGRGHESIELPMPKLQARQELLRALFT